MWWSFLLDSFLDNFIHSHQHDRAKHAVNGKWDTDNNGVLVNKNGKDIFLHKFIIFTEILIIICYFPQFEDRETGRLRNYLIIQFTWVYI